MPQTKSPLHEDYLVRLQNAIRQLNGCESRYVETVTVSERFPNFHKSIVCEAEVGVFEVIGHPRAGRAYAWSYAQADKETQYVVVLEIPPVTSPQTAVQAAIAAQIVKGPLIKRVRSI